MCVKCFTLRIIIILMETIKDLDNQHGSDGLTQKQRETTPLVRKRRIQIALDAQAIFRRRRHQPRRPPPAKIRPGRPAPATGPRTLAGVMLPPSELANIGAAGNTARSPASVQGRRQKAVGPPQYKSES